MSNTTIKTSLTSPIKTSITGTVKPPIKTPVKPPKKIIEQPINIMYPIDNLNQLITSNLSNGLTIPGDINVPGNSNVSGTITANNIQGNNITITNCNSIYSCNNNMFEYFIFNIYEVFLKTQSLSNIISSINRPQYNADQWILMEVNVGTGGSKTYVQNNIWYYTYSPSPQDKMFPSCLPAFIAIPIGWFSSISGIKAT